MCPCPHDASDVAYSMPSVAGIAVVRLNADETDGLQAGMIERNKGLLIADHESLLHESSNGLVRHLTAHAGEAKDLDVPTASPARRRAAALTKTTNVKCAFASRVPLRPGPKNRWSASFSQIRECEQSFHASTIRAGAEHPKLIAALHTLH